MSSSPNFSGESGRIADVNIHLNLWSMGTHKTIFK